MVQPNVQQNPQPNAKLAGPGVRPNVHPKSGAPVIRNSIWSYAGNIGEPKKISEPGHRIFTYKLRPDMMDKMMDKMKTMKMKIMMATVVAIMMCGVAAFGQSAPQMGKAEREIRAALNSTADGWNNGDLSKYLAVYTKDATEMLSTGPKGGVEVIEDTMKRGFWKAGRPEQTLRYEHVLVRMLGKDGAVVTGQYVLTGAGKPDRTGWFTTAWIRTKDGWRMMHDHS